MDGHLEPLEKLFQQVEEENERRANEAVLINTVTEELKKSNLEAAARSRRRGSISITKFGQLADQAVEKGSSGPGSPARPDTANSQSAFFQRQLDNASTTSFASGVSGDEAAHVEEHHTTHVQKIAPRQSISRAVGGLLPRQLSRARSSSVVDTEDANVIIGVAVEEATVETPEDEAPIAAVVHAPAGLRNQTSRLSMASSQGRAAWASKVKGFTKKFRRKSSKPAPAEST